MKTNFLKSVIVFGMLYSANLFGESLDITTLPVLNDVAIVLNDPCASLEPGWACPAVMPNDELQFSVTSKCEGSYEVIQTKLYDGNIALRIVEVPQLMHLPYICEASPVKRKFSINLGPSLSEVQYVLVNKIGLVSNN